MIQRGYCSFALGAVSVPDKLTSSSLAHIRFCANFKTGESSELQLYKGTLQTLTGIRLVGLWISDFGIFIAVYCNLLSEK